MSNYYALAKRLCDLMEADDRDFLKGERIGLIWQVEGELKRSLEQTPQPEAGPTTEDWKCFAREVVRGTQPEDYGKWSSYYQRVMGEAVRLLDRCAPQPNDAPK